MNYDDKAGHMPPAGRVFETPELDGSVCVTY